jgi:peptidyl-prolyl cis-trans isomerase C
MTSREKARVQTPARGRRSSAKRAALSLICAAPLLLAGCSGGCGKSKTTDGATSAAASGSAAPRALDPALAGKVLAKVGDRTITLGEYAETLERMDPFERMRYQSADRRKRLLEEMIEVELLAQEARRRGLDKAPETQERLRQILRDQLLEEVRKGGPAPDEIPEADLRAYYDQHKAEFAEPERRRVAAIVLDSASAARGVLPKALKATPAEWGKLVEQHAKRAPGGPTAPAELAGDLGIVGPPGHPRGNNPRVPEAVREAVFKIPAPGTTHTEVVEADGKFYVLRLTSKTDARERKYEDSSRAIRTAVVQARIRDRESTLEKELRQRFPVKIDDAALSTVAVPSASPATSAAPHSHGPRIAPPPKAPVAPPPPPPAPPQ